MILVATKSDMDNDRKVTRKQGEALAEKYNIKLIESSAKNNENVGKVFEELTEGIVTRYEAENKLQESKEISNTALGKKKQESKKGDCCWSTTFLFAAYYSFQFNITRLLIWHSRSSMAGLATHC